MKTRKQGALRVSFDRRRTIAMLRLLLHARDDQQFLTAETADLVENQVPVGVVSGSREHALFLFAVVPNDRGVRSASLWDRAKLLYADEAWLFQPERVSGAPPARIARDVHRLLLERLKPRYVNHAVSGWISNAGRLRREFDSDARAVFAHGPDGASAYKAIRSFFGFGPKTGGMMYRAATGLGWASREAAETIEVPVDTHDVRISLYMGITRTSGPIETSAFASLAAPVRRELTEACRELGAEWFEFDRAMWLIGSRGCARRRCALCPISKLCSQASRTSGQPRAIRTTAAKAS